MADLVRWRNDKERKPLLLRGVRQTGKTYLLREFGATHFPRFFHFNFEKDPKLCQIFETDLIPKRILEGLSFHAGASIDPAQDLVIFDEIQACPNALTSLKYFYEDLPSIHLCAAGSLLGVHLAPVSFPVGKVSFLTLNPMSFEEFLMATGDSRSLEAIEGAGTSMHLARIAHEHLWEQLKHYFVVGGLPEVVASYISNQDNLFDAFSIVRKKQEDLIFAYYADIAKHSGKISAMHIDRVLRSVPSQLQSVHDGSVARFKFKGVIPGISHYERLAGAIDWLFAAGLVNKVHIVNSGLLPFRAYAKESHFKLMLFDVGILGSMSGLTPKTILDYDYGTYKGYFAENFVAQEFCSSGASELFSWSEKTAEIEFLRQIDGEVIPIEVKSGSVTHAKSLSVFSEKYAPPYRVIFSAKPLDINPKKALHQYPLYLAGRFPIVKQTTVSTSGVPSNKSTG